MPNAPEKFAKIFEFDDVGQVLIYCGTNKHGAPAIIIVMAGNDIVQPVITRGYSDTEAGENARDRCFSEIGESDARSFADEIKSMMVNFTGNA